MVEIELYVTGFIDNLKQKFGSRLLYVGLQGSFMRGEADENSDIDMMVILDSLTVADMDTYRHIIEETGYVDKACGFICGEEELSHWNPCEICHLVHTTKDYYGTLSRFIPPYDAADIKNYIKISLNNLYHEICHRYIHESREKNIEALPGTYKCVFFILQNLHFWRTGSFVATKKELLTQLKDDEDKAVLQMALDLKNRPSFDFNKAYSLLFSWCQTNMNAL